MHEPLTISREAESIGIADAENTSPVTLGHSEEATSNGASHAGPRVERAEARQQRDASTAPVTISVIARDITDYKAFVTFLQDAGFSRAFAKRVINRDAFKSSAAEPSAELSQVADAIAQKVAEFAQRMKGT